MHNAVRRNSTSVLQSNRQLHTPRILQKETYLKCVYVSNICYYTTTSGPYIKILFIYLSMALQPFVVPWPLFSFLILYTVGRTPWTGDQPVARPLPTHRTTQTQNKRTQTSMSRVGFEPTIPVFGRAKTVHALDCAASVIGTLRY
jgi:hypothetical protein